MNSMCHTSAIKQTLPLSLIVIPTLTFTLFRCECIQKSLYEKTWLELLAPLLHWFLRSGNFRHLTTVGTQYGLSSNGITTSFCVFCQTFSAKRMVAADSALIFEDFHDLYNNITTASTKTTDKRQSY